ncbi:MAG: DUF6455 family protein [Pseudopelagicola sp.]|nr:DUF6455 family protein [Pseudopelagicola sp.]
MTLFDKLGKHADLVGGMSERLGVDWAQALEAHPDLAARYRSAVLNCTHCQKVGECQGWQTGHAHAKDAPNYCLNKGLLKDLASES